MTSYQTDAAADALHQLPDNFEPWTDILLNGTVRFLLDLNLDRARITASLHALADRVETGASVLPIRSPDVEVMTRVCSVVYDWVHDPQSTAGDPARPKPLWPASGTPTLSELIGKQFPTEEVPMIIQWMENAQVITRQSDGSFSLTHDANVVLIEPNINLSVERFATHVTRLLQSGLTNLRSNDESVRNLERSSHVRHLPVRYVPAFLALAKQLGQAFLDSIDGYLESRADDNSREPTVAAGLHIYTYYGSPSQREAFPSRDNPTDDGG